MVSRADFSLHVDKYVRNCVRVLRQEVDKHASDKTKLRRVISQFVKIEDIQDYLEDRDLNAHFKADKELDCSKKLKIVAVSFESEAKFLDSVTARVYALRCSIVHSNPEFDETKAIPFVATPENLETLRTEIELVSELARMVITGSAIKGTG